MNTIIVSNVHSKPLYDFAELNPIVSLTPDYPYPKIGHFRCFHGHTNALKAYMEDDIALVIEDDCVPDQTLPWRAAIDAAQLMIMYSDYEMVCLHGRGFDFSKFEKREQFAFDWLAPKTEDRWVLGTLIYVINRQAAKKFCDADFWTHATNIDIFLWSKNFNFCLLDPRQFVTDATLSETRIAENPPPFIHGRGGETSMIEHPRNTEYVIR